MRKKTKHVDLNIRGVHFFTLFGKKLARPGAVRIYGFVKKWTLLGKKSVKAGAVRIYRIVKKWAPGKIRSKTARAAEWKAEAFCPSATRAGGDRLIDIAAVIPYGIAENGSSGGTRITSLR